MNGGNKIDVYCDESCHLEYDQQPAMLFGCVWVSGGDKSRLSEELRQLKEKHSMRGELKWQKVSNSRLEFFLAVVRWFFSTPSLHFRALVVANKHELDHETFNAGSHNEFYYKMYYFLLREILSSENEYRIYIDIKDTRSEFKIRHLRKVLCYDRRDFESRLITRIQHVRSQEIELLQLADFLLGAVSYRHRHLKTSKSKMAIVAEIEKSLGRSVLLSTSRNEEKFNTFVLKLKEKIGDG